MNMNDLYPRNRWVSTFTGAMPYAKWWFQHNKSGNKRAGRLCWYCNHWLRDNTKRYLKFYRFDVYKWIRSIDGQRVSIVMERRERHYKHRPYASRLGIRRIRQ